MAGFRVTKYDPALRRRDGSYGRDEWTSVSDIGRRYLGVEVGVADYLAVEDCYVESVRRFLGAWMVPSLCVIDLELKGVSAALSVVLQAQAHDELLHLSEGVDVRDVSLERVVRLALREVIWCRLEGARGAYVHFGYDFYMYLGCDMPDAPLPLLPTGMYAEPFVSPYLRVE